MTSRCEACEIHPAVTVEPCDDDASPYHLCDECYTRLHARALRPLEWFNLAKRHGWRRFLLHDDFYDEDGTASQPECHVESPEQYAAPTLDDVASDTDALLDFTITRWHFEESIANAWRALPAVDVLQSVTRRFAEPRNADVKSAILDAASTLGRRGEEFVRYAWGDYPQAVDLASIARASAFCLPNREGFARTIEALSHCGEREKRDLMFALSYFHSPEALDWIENNVFSPISESWGRLAAASRFDWQRASRWLEQGRPLSLVALDALLAIIRPQSPFLREYAPRLYDPPDFSVLERSLASNAERDAAPRVTKATETILKNATLLGIGG